MKYRGIIFDLDGVICFTDEYHYLAWKKLANRLGIPFDKEMSSRLRGISRMESMDIILKNSTKGYTKEEKEDLAQEKNHIYVEMLKRMTPQDLSMEVKNTMNRLRTDGCLLAIGSSSRNAERILTQIGLKEYFDAVSDGNNITKSKPAPEVFLKAAAFLKLSPEDCLVVEDAVAGIDAAHAGGFASAGLGDAASYEKTTYRMNKFEDLLNIE